MKLNLDELIKLADDIDDQLFGDKSNEDLFKHLQEEMDEFKEATGNAEVWKNNNEFYTKYKLEQLKELGDAFFCFLSVARQNKLDLTHGLSLTITKLQERIKFNIK